MSVITVAAGQPIRASHVNQFSRWLTGVTKDISSSLTTTHATEYTLTATNEVATGNILKLAYGTGTAVAAVVSGTAASFSVPTTFAATVTFSGGFSFGTAPLLLGNGTLAAPSQAFATDTNTGRRWVSADYMEDVVGGESVIRYANGAEFPQIGIGNIDEPGPGGTANILHVHWQNSTNTQGNVIGVASEITNNSTSASGNAPGDFSAFSGFVYQTASSANNAMRAFEGHAIATSTGAAAHTNATLMAAELGIHSARAGNGVDRTLGIYLTSHNADGQTNATMADTALRILGTAGWANFIYATNTAGALTFHVDNQGIIRSSTAANAAAPTYSWVGGSGFSDKGWYSAGSGLFAAAAGATEVARFGQTNVSITPNGTTQVSIGTAGVNVAGTLSVTGAATITGVATLITGATVGGNLGVTGTATVTGVATFVTRASVGGAFSAAGVSNLNGITNAGVLIESVLSPSAIATDVTDYGPTGIATASFVQVSSTAAVTLGGITAAQVLGQRLTFVNTGSTNITLLHETTAAAAANRFNTHTNTDYTLASAKGISIYYTGSRWRTLAP